MKITKQQLKVIIKEELEAVMRESESPEEQGVKILDQEIPSNVLANPKVAKELSALQGKSQEEIAAMLSGGLEEADGGMMAAQAQARKSALDSGETMDPKTKAQKAKEIIVGSGIPVAGAIVAGALSAMALTALGASMTPQMLAVWALTSLMGWVKGKEIDTQDAMRNQYAGVDPRDSVLETRRRRRR